MKQRYGYIGQVTPSQLIAWFLSDQSQSLPGENPKQESPSKGKRPSKKRTEELMRQEAAIRRFRLTAKHRRRKSDAVIVPSKTQEKERVKPVTDGLNSLRGITLFADGTWQRDGIKQTR